MLIKIITYLFIIIKFALKPFFSTKDSTELKSHDNWVLRKGFELMMIPLTFISVIFGMYSSTIDERLKSKSYSVDFYDYLKPSTYLDIFKSELITDTNIPSDSIGASTIGKNKVNHLIIIDQTSSMKNDGFDNKAQAFKDSIKSDLRKYRRNKISNEIIGKVKSVRELVQLSIFNTLVKSDTNNIDSVLIKFYHGSKKLDLDQSKFSNLKIQSTDDVRVCWNSFKELIALQNSLTNNAGKIFKGVKTSFKDILGEIESNVKNNTIVTLIGDFYDDSGEVVSHEDISNFFKKNGAKVIKFNLVKLPTNKEDDFEVSNRLIEKIKDNINTNVTFDNIIIQLREYQDDSFSNSKWLDYKSKVLHCLKKVPEDSSKLNFYYPFYDSYGRKIAKGSISVKAHEEGIRSWLISTEPITVQKYLGQYKTSSDKNWVNYKSNKRYYYDNFDTTINFTLNYVGSNYGFNIDEGSSTNPKYFQINVLNLMPKPIARLGFYSIYFVLFLTSLLICAHFFRDFSFLFYNNSIKDLVGSKRINTLLISQAVLVVIYSYLILSILTAFSFFWMFDIIISALHLFVILYVFFNPSFYKIR